MNRRQKEFAEARTESVRLERLIGIYLSLRRNGWSHTVSWEFATGYVQSTTCPA